MLWLELKGFVKGGFEEGSDEGDCSWCCRWGSVDGKVFILSERFWGWDVFELIEEFLFLVFLYEGGKYFFLVCELVFEVILVWY